MNWRSSLTWLLIILALACLTVGFFWVALFVVPGLIVNHDLNSTSTLTGSQRQLQMAQLTSARGNVVSVALGVTVLASAFFAILKAQSAALQSQVEIAKLGLSERNALADRMRIAVTQASSDSSTLREVGIVSLGSIMRETEATDSNIAHQIAAILGNLAVSSTLQRHAADEHPPPEFRSCIRAFDGLDQDTSIWLNLKGCDASSWTFELPANIEVNLEKANLSNSTVRGFGTYIRLAGADINNADLTSPGLILVTDD